MIIRLLDERHNEVLNVKVDLNDKMYMVVPVIANHEFDYMRPRLMDVRKFHMQQYLENPEEYQKCRNDLIIAIMNILDNEIKILKETKDKRYYVA